jgi:hypothetical protein
MEDSGESDNNSRDDVEGDIPDEDNMECEYSCPEEELEGCLHRLDLSFVHTVLRPQLNPFHKKRLDGVLHEVLTKSAVSMISKVQLPPAIMDYRNVPRPTELIGSQPELATEDRSVPGFEVENKREDNSIKLPMDKFVYLVETLLSFQTFLKYGCNLLLSRPTASLEYDKALELFLRLLVTTVDRGEDTNQWYLQKTLELMHFKMDILFLGPASGFSTETGEQGLKATVKNCSKEG